MKNQKKSKKQVKSSSVKKITKKSPQKISSQKQPKKSLKQKITDKIKEKEEKQMAEEERKLKLQEERAEIYKERNDPTKFYVTNKGLMEELLKWKNSAKKVEDRVLSERLGLMFMEIARKITNHSFFRNYSQWEKEDMQIYAHEKLISGLKNYNFKFKNPFAYFSQACFNAFKTTLSKKYKQENIKRSLKKMAVSKLEEEMPGSSYGKCLENGLEDDDYYDYE